MFQSTGKVENILYMVTKQLQTSCSEDPIFFFKIRTMWTWQDEIDGVTGLRFYVLARYTSQEHVHITIYDTIINLKVTTS